MTSEEPFSDLNVSIETLSEYSNDGKTIKEKQVVYDDYVRKVYLSEDLPYITKVNFRGLLNSNKYSDALNKSLLLLVNYIIARRNNRIEVLLPNKGENVLELLFISLKDITGYIDDQRNIEIRMSEENYIHNFNFILPNSYIRLINFTDTEWNQFKKFSPDRYYRYVDTLRVIATLILNYLIGRKNRNIEKLVPKEIEDDLINVVGTLRGLSGFITN